MKKISLYLFLFLPSFLFSQQPCGFNEKIMEYLHQHPQAEAYWIQERKKILETRDLIESEEENRSEIVVVIPVVFHVIHSGQSIGTASNISDAQILSQLEVLNRDFRKRNNDTLLIPAIFKNLAADVRVEFCLATTDPSGNATNGITRHQYNNTSNFDAAIKPVTQWDFTRYLNIWSTTLSGTLLGYATPPGLFPDNEDGVVVDYRQIGEAPANPFGTNPKGRTAVHEVGHWLGLWHPFQDGCVGTSSSSCSLEGDFICDTPPASAEQFGCPNLANLPNSCTESPIDMPDMFPNYMGYFDEECQGMFTYGQRNMMRATLFTNRVSILNSNGCTSAGTFTFTGTVRDQNGNAVGGAQVLLDGPSDVQVSANVNGEFTIANVKQGFYNLYAAKWGYSTTEYATGFLITPSTPPAQIVINNNHYYDDFVMDLGWTKFDNATSGFWIRDIPKPTYLQGVESNTRLDVINDYGIQCFVTGNSTSTNPNADDVDGGTNYLFSPVMDLTSYTNPVVTFKKRYFNGPVSGSSADDVMTIKMSNGTQTVTLQTVSYDVANGSGWTTSSIPLNGLINLTNNMKIQIEVGDNGNQNVVEGGFDHFQITEGTVDIEEVDITKVKIFPLPANNEVEIQWEGDKAEMLIFDINGKLIATDVFYQNSIKWDVSLFQNGVYIINVKGDDFNSIQKLIIKH